MSTKIVIENVVRRTQVNADGQTRDYFLGQMQSSQAGEITFVPVVKDEAQKVKRTKTYLIETNNGYQRPGSPRRMEAFGRYLIENDQLYIPSVVLSGRNKWVFSEAEKTLTIEGPAAIIDGQHRVGGYISAFQNDEVDRLIDFVVLNISEADEQQLFLDINSNAKSVATGLVSVLGRRTDSIIADTLNSHPDSPFVDRFYITSKVPGTLFNISSVAKEIGTTFRHGVFEDIKDEVDLKFDILCAYWEAIEDAFPVEWSDMTQKPNLQEYKLLELTGLMAMSLAAEEILAPSFDMASSTMNFGEVEEKIKFLADSKELDWSKSGAFKGQTGYGGAGPIHRKIQQILAKFGK
jgi:DNA sulfur modification protein DndB